MAKLVIYINESDIAALRILAQQEYRDPRSQAALIIRQELVRRSLLTQEQKTDSNYHTQPAINSPVN